MSAAAAAGLSEGSPPGPPGATVDGVALARLYGEPLFALLFHSLNGLRIVAVDFFPGVIRNERKLFVAVLVITVVAGLPGGYIIMLPWLEGNVF